MKGGEMVARSTTGGSLSPLEGSDAALLERFVNQSDEAAFAALLARHGPMVFGVCRRFLSHAQDAEDAFQATFLVFVRKAASISRRELLGNWLYGVAARVAARARLVAAKHRAREAVDMTRVAEATREPATSSDLSAAALDEVQRLPTRYRVPVVLYYLQVRTVEEIACELCCPVGTIKTRLSRAREMLRRRLTRRGLGLSNAAFSAALLALVPAAALPQALVDSTCKAAIAFAAGDAAAGGLVSAQAVALTKGVLHTMFVTKMKILAALVLALAVIAGGVGAFTYQVLAAEARARNNDKDNIQGTWKFVSIKANGAENDEQTMKFKDVDLVITADKFTMMNYGKQRKQKEATYKIDATTKPRTLDVSFVPQDGRERTVPCIYKLEGDTLTICSRLEERTKRPKDFTCEPDSDTVVQVWKRAPK